MFQIPDTGMYVDNQWVMALSIYGLNTFIGFSRRTLLPFSRSFVLASTIYAKLTYTALHKCIYVVFQNINKFYYCLVTVSRLG